MIFTKKEAFKELLNNFGDILGNSDCNDFQVANTPEMYLMLEEAAAENFAMNLESFRESSIYEDFKPAVSEDGKIIYTLDYIILDIIKKELGL